MDMSPNEYKKMKALHSRAEKIGKPAFRKEIAKWHPIGAGRVGDKYKGGVIKKIDAKNAKALVAKKMSSHEAIREWKETGVKPKGLKKVSFKEAFSKGTDGIGYISR